MCSLIFIVLVAYLAWITHVYKHDPKRFQEFRQASFERNKKFLRIGGEGLMALVKMWLK